HTAVRAADVVQGLHQVVEGALLRPRVLRVRAFLIPALLIADLLLVLQELDRRLHVRDDLVVRLLAGLALDLGLALDHRDAVLASLLFEADLELPLCLTLAGPLSLFAGQLLGLLFRGLPASDPEIPL